MATLADVTRQSFTQPLRDHNVDQYLQIGRSCYYAARPRMIISEQVGGMFRTCWDKVNAPRAFHKIIALGCNAFKALPYFRTRGEGARWVRADDVKHWHFPKPSPETLITARRTFEKVNSVFHFTWFAKKGIHCGVKVLNWGYRSMYGEDFFPDLPALPEGMEDLIFGNRSRKPFDARVDDQFIQSLKSNLEILDPAETESLSKLGRLKNLAANDIKRVFQHATNLTLEETKEQRRAMIRAIEGIMLRLIYDRIAAKIPDKDVLLRETALYIFNQALPTVGILQFIRNLVPISSLNPLFWVLKQDFVESAANDVGAAVNAGIRGYSQLATCTNRFSECLNGELPEIGMVANMTSQVAGMAAKQTLLHGSSLALKYGPLIYGMIYRELDALAQEGNQCRTEIATFGGLKALWKGDGMEPGEAYVQVDDLEYVRDIASSFTYGTISRMCQGRGIMGVLRLALNQITTSSSSAPSSIAGLEEAKTAFKETTSAIYFAFFKNLRASFAAEWERQKQNAAEVHTAIVERQGEIHRSQSQYLSAIMGNCISADAIEAVLTAPTTLATTAVSAIDNQCVTQ